MVRPREKRGYGNSRDRGQIEPEAIDVHLTRPVAQAVHDHAPDRRMACLQRVACSGVVGVLGAVFPPQLVSGIVQASETLRRSVAPALRHVMEDNIENHFDAAPV